MADKILYLFGEPPVIPQAAVASPVPQSDLLGTLSDIFNIIAPDEHLNNRIILDIIKLLGYECTTYRCNEKDIIYSLPISGGRFYLYGEISTESLDAGVSMVVSNTAWQKVLQHVLIYGSYETGFPVDAGSITYVREYNKTVQMESVVQLDGIAIDGLAGAGKISLVSYGHDKYKKQTSECFELTSAECENLKGMLSIASRINEIIVGGFSV